jgi:hypothetical protein
VNVLEAAWYEAIVASKPVMPTRMPSSRALRRHTTAWRNRASTSAKRRLHHEVLARDLARVELLLEPAQALRVMQCLDRLASRTATRARSMRSRSCSTSSAGLQHPAVDAIDHAGLLGHRPDFGRRVQLARVAAQSAQQPGTVSSAVPRSDAIGCEQQLETVVLDRVLDLVREIATFRARPWRRRGLDQASRACWECERALRSTRRCLGSALSTGRTASLQHLRETVAHTARLLTREL